jgi:type VI secretion system protein ImpH
MRSTRDPLAFWQAVTERPWEHDFYHALRRIECLYADGPRIGKAVRPAQEPIRLGQDPSLDFAPAVLSGVSTGADHPATIRVRFLGLLGPNGPLPLYLTDYARERLLHGGDATFVRFLDIFNHRFLSLFYRAWAQAQPAVMGDRPLEDHFPVYVGSLFGLGSARVRHRDAVPDAAKLFHAGLLIRQVRNRDGLESLLKHYFKVPAHVEEFSGRWLDIAAADRSRLGARDGRALLGSGVVLGVRTWDRQHSIRISIGPLALARYECFLPSGADLEALVVWLRTYLCFELTWELRVALRAEEVPRLRLGAYGRLGWSTWLGEYRRSGPADDLLLDAERSIERHRTARTAGSHAIAAIAA